jgi:hypothetical protein
MQEVAAMMATSGAEFALFALAAIVVMTVITSGRAIGMLFRAADRSARNLRRTLDSVSRSIFGPGGRPEEIARRLGSGIPPFFAPTPEQTILVILFGASART